MKRMYASLALVSLALTACGGSGDDRPPVNQAPQISAIADQNVTANGSSQPIAFSLADENVDELTLSASSDRQQVLPDDGITLTGSGSARSLTVTPRADEAGDAFVTIVVSDPQGLSAGASFLLTVQPEQKSMQQFARDTFVSDENGEPELINAVEFAEDAENDDFADLLTP
ncbi:MAG: hypothetical protein AAFX56_12040 [Pseudomonadota bacterium]